MTDQGPANYQRATSPTDYGITDAVDIGHGTWISFMRDRDGNEIGINEWHNCKHDFTAGSVYFDNEAARRAWPVGQFWTVEQREPLTISPSVACGTCGHHGFIRNGQWVPA